MNTKEIASIEVIRPGSNPDIDTDFNTSVRDLTLDHISEVHGSSNVANIITFNTLAAKSAFKTMCTIYQIPFSSANKIASLIPEPIEGVGCTIADIFNPASDRYAEGADFRQATSGENWNKIIEGAKNIEGRYKSTGMHPCGLIISSEPLNQVVPLQVRQDDGRVLTQWSYPECESLGLIKFDLLGLDTVDLIQHTVEYIAKFGKTPPNMVEIIHGPMDDKKTYEMLSAGETVGVFQLGSKIVQDFLRLMKPTDFYDIAASTALMRPGPMGMTSHVRYANRKNNEEEIEAIHPDFVGSPLEDILKDTYGLCVFQEQILKIANQIAGMTLQEGDDLRSAMGKKKMKVMLSMRAKFFEGAQANGYSEEAVRRLWDTIAEFAKYGFNLSHAVAYAMDAYQAAYLKANYPVEFISALIAQNVGDKNKILMYLKEARRMGLKVGSVDINLSDVEVAPDFTQTGEYDIVYGLSGINGVSKDIAKIIVNERTTNGEYKSVQDLINRCSPLGVTTRSIYENLALAGAFDKLGVTRKAVAENLPSMLGEAKTKTVKGTSLFDFFEVADTAAEVDLSSIGEYPFVEKLQKEANVIGLYLTSHPISRVGKGLSAARVIPIKKLLTARSTTSATIVGSITEITKKSLKNGGKSLQVTIDDGSSYITANAVREIVKGIDKKIAQDRLKRFYERGETTVNSDVEMIVVNDQFTPIDDIVKNTIYLMDVIFTPTVSGQYSARITSIKPLSVTDEGTLPIRIRVSEKLNNSNTAGLKERITKFAKAVSNAHPGKYPIYAAIITESDTVTVKSTAAYYKQLISDIKTFKGDTKNKSSSKAASIFSDKEITESKSPTKAEKVRDLPPFVNDDKKNLRNLNEEELSETVEYFDTGYCADKSSAVEILLSNKFGAERVDFGVFNKSMRSE
jgi:DNA polymerase-3 subunit alpha